MYYVENVYYLKFPMRLFEFPARPCPRIARTQLAAFPRSAPVL